MGFLSDIGDELKPSKLIHEINPLNSDLANQVGSGFNNLASGVGNALQNLGGGLGSLASLLPVLIIGGVAIAGISLLKK